MRRIALLLAVGLIMAACGDDDAAPTTEPVGTTTVPPTTTTGTPTTAAQVTTTTAATTTSAAPSTTAATSTTLPASTSSTLPYPTFGVPAVEHCVIDTQAADHLNVREGPSIDYSIVGELAPDATGVTGTGLAAEDDQERVWIQIDHGLGDAWVAGWHLTPGPCRVGNPGTACVVDTTCDDRLNVRVVPGVEFNRLGSLPFNASEVVLTGVAANDSNGREWWQIEFRGELGWAASWFLDSGSCAPSPGQPCLLPTGPPAADCENGWTTPVPGSTDWNDALTMIGAYGPGARTDPAAFVVDVMRYCVGPEDVNILAPRPPVERWYIEGYSEVDPTYRGRWLVRRTNVGFGLAWVAPYGTTGFGSGTWETCVDPCMSGRPLAGEWCDAGCIDDPFEIPCTGIAPGTWAPGECFGLPPEVLGCFAGL